MGCCVSDNSKKKIIHSTTRIKAYGNDTTNQQMHSSRILPEQNQPKLKNEDKYSISAQENVNKFAPETLNDNQEDEFLFSLERNKIMPYNEQMEPDKVESLTELKYENKIHSKGQVHPEDQSTHNPKGIVNEDIHKRISISSNQNIFQQKKHKTLLIMTKENDYLQQNILRRDDYDIVEDHFELPNKKRSQIKTERESKQSKNNEHNDDFDVL